MNYQETNENCMKNYHIVNFEKVKIKTLSKFEIKKNIHCS